MNLKLRALSVGVLFFAADAAMAQRTKPTDTKEIEEVVVVGYVKKKASEVVGVSQKLKAEEIKSPTSQTVESSLQGRAAGVNVSTSSGTPGAVQDVRIRGNNSINSNTRPLYVIDGVPVVEGEGRGSTALSTFSINSTINNDDIESVTVLKDASSTSQYGARGANGVILITTKRGKKGKARYGFDTSIGFQNDAFMKLRTLSAEDRYSLLVEGLKNQYPKDYPNDQAIVEDMVKSNYGGYNEWVKGGRQSYDWNKALSNENAMLNTASFNVSFGTDKSTFYASLGANETEATVVGPAFKRYSALIRMTNDLSESVKLENSINGSFTQQNPILDQGAYFGNPFVSKIMMSSWINPYNADGTPATNMTSYNTGLFNPIYQAENNEIRTRIYRLLSNNRLDWKINKNFNFAQVLALDVIHNDYKSYRNRVHGDGQAKSGYLEQSIAQDITFTSQSSIGYTGRLDKSVFNATLLNEFISVSSPYLYAYADTFAVNGIKQLAGAAANDDADGSYSDRYNNSVLAVLNYTYDNFLILDGSYRVEGSSRFAPGKRYGNFWSVGAAVNLHKKLNSTFINEFKPRFSIGTTGNSGIPANVYQQLLALNANYAGLGASYPSNFGNPNLTWEKQRMWDAGVDFGILNRRITGSVGYFYKKTYDLLYAQPFSRTTGYADQYFNVGALSNQGWELQVSADVVRSENFNWNVFANYGTLENKVIELAKDLRGNDLNPNAGSSYKTTVVGEPLGTWYMRKWAGVDPATGAPTWYVNGVDGAVTSNYNAAQQSFQGNSYPKFNGGFGTRLNFKGISLDGLFTFAGGHKIYDDNSAFYFRTNAAFYGNSYNGTTELLTRWQKPGDITNVPVLSWNKNDFFHSASTRHLYDGDYLRLREVGISYTLPSDVISQIGLTGLTFGLKGTNMMTWVKDKNLKLDPEVRPDGYTRLTTPPVKAVVFTTSIKF